MLHLTAVFCKRFFMSFSMRSCDYQTFRLSSCEQTGHLPVAVEAPQLLGPPVLLDSSTYATSTRSCRQEFPAAVEKRKLAKLVKPHRGDNLITVTDNYC